MDDYTEAKLWWQKAIESAPQFLPSVFSLFDAALTHKDLATAGEMVQKVSQREGASLNWAQMAARLAEAEGGTAKAEALLRQALTDHPDSMGPRLALPS